MTSHRGILVQIKDRTQKGRLHKRERRRLAALLSGTRKTTRKSQPKDTDSSGSCIGDMGKGFKKR